MGISIGNLSDLISYDKVVSITVASIVSLLVWFILNGNHKNNKNKEHDEKLFKQPPPREDCPICFLRLPFLDTGKRYMSCCGKVLCSGCYYAPVYDDQGNIVDNEKCPFCRTPPPKNGEEIVERTVKRMEVNDPLAIYNLGGWYNEGEYGYQQDRTKALELWHRAGELGYAKALCNIGYAYQSGESVEVDKKKAVYYCELAALGGEVTARDNLGSNEILANNKDRALKHYMIAVGGGNIGSLKKVQELYKYEIATKEDYTKALQSYQAYLGEIKSPQRDEAAAFDSETYRYY